MLKSAVDLLRCPVTRSRLTVQIIKESTKELDNNPTLIIEEGILFSKNEWFYPIINGIPRLGLEAFLDYEVFLTRHLDDYKKRKDNLLAQYGDWVNLVVKKNKRTKQSFSEEWKVYNHETDKTWDADSDAMLSRFLAETGETIDSIKGKVIFDAGCGNGKLNYLLASKGILNLAMDLGTSIEDANARNKSSKVIYIQGDVQFPPVTFKYFDIVHSSGVLHHTNNTELSFSCIEPAVKNGGKLSIWLYQPRNNFVHNLFNLIRSVTSKIPSSFQYGFCLLTIFPISFCIKKLKGNKQNSREMMVDILDWFTPEFRFEHTHTEVAAWFTKRQYTNVKVTTNEVFGFNTTAVKSTDVE